MTVSNQKSFKQIILLALTVFFAACSIGKKPSAANSKLDIYILMGQSNMAGRGKLQLSDSMAPNKKVFMLTKNLVWLPAKNPIHFDKPGVAGVGPGLAFGLAMRKVTKGSRNIGLVPTAVGGTSIDTWVPNGYDKATQTHPYDDAEKRIIEAMKTGVIKGVIWHQGEADSQLENAENYLPKLIALIKRVRRLTDNPNLPFVVGELGRYKPQYEHINKQLAKLSTQAANTAVASSENLIHKGDGVHFDSESANKFGVLFAEKMILLQSKTN